MMRFMSALPVSSLSSLFSLGVMPSLSVMPNSFSCNKHTKTRVSPEEACPGTCQSTPEHLQKAIHGVLSSVEAQARGHFTHVALLYMLAFCTVQQCNIIPPAHVTCLLKEDMHPGLGHSAGSHDRQVCGVQTRQQSSQGMHAGTLLSFMQASMMVLMGS